MPNSVACVVATKRLFGFGNVFSLSAPPLLLLVGRSAHW
jgi:hypothetical protein